MNPKLTADVTSVRYIIRYRVIKSHREKVAPSQEKKPDNPVRCGNVNFSGVFDVFAVFGDQLGLQNEGSK
jgi:hypothetical protein